MKLKLKIGDRTKVVTLSDEAVLKDLRSEIGGSSISEIRSGFPPKPVDLVDDRASLRDLGIRSGEQLIVRTKGGPSEQDSQSVPKQPENLSKQAEKPPGYHNVKAAAGPAESDIPYVRCGENFLKVRIMEDDNSCLFRAVAYTVMRDVDAMFELRQIVASAIGDNPIDYSDAILGKKRQEYISWILRENSWGGAIELDILSKHFNITICSLDVSSLRVDYFNPGQNTFVIVIYSGIHYDAVALSPIIEDVDAAELDTTVFEADEHGAQVQQALKSLGDMLKEKHYYTDTASFQLKCKVCGQTLVGERGATQHASQTGHYDFGEVK